MNTAAALPDCITRQCTGDVHHPNCDYCRQNETRQCIFYVVALTQEQADHLDYDEKIRMRRCPFRLPYDPNTRTGRAYCDNHPRFCPTLNTTYKTTCGPSGPKDCVEWDQDKSDYNKLVSSVAEAKTLQDIATNCADEREQFKSRCVHPAAWNTGHYTQIEIAKAIAENCELIGVTLRREVGFKLISMATKERKAKEKAERDAAKLKEKQSNSAFNESTGQTESTPVLGRTRSETRKLSSDSSISTSTAVIPSDVADTTAAASFPSVVDLIPDLNEIAAESVEEKKVTKVVKIKRRKSRRKSRRKM
jgi:hypothetical protein